MVKMHKFLVEYKEVGDDHDHMTSRDIVDENSIISADSWNSLKEQINLINDVKVCDEIIAECNYEYSQDEYSEKLLNLDDFYLIFTDVLDFKNYYTETRTLKIKKLMN